MNHCVATLHLQVEPRIRRQWWVFFQHVLCIQLNPLGQELDVSDSRYDPADMMLSNIDNSDGVGSFVAVPFDSLIDLPNELLVDIMECLPDEALLELTKVSSRFRTLAALVYLRRLEILVAKEDHHAVYLSGQVPPPAVLLLSSVSLTQNVILVCELYFLIQYEDALSLFCSKTSVVTDVSVYIPDSELSMLALPEVPGALRRFLAALSHSQSCTALAIKVQYHSYIQRQIPAVVRKQLQADIMDKMDKQIMALMRTVTRVGLSTVLFEREELLKVGQMLLKGPSVFDCHLLFHSRASVSKVLSRTSFPAVQYLRISSPFPINPPAPFLRRHGKMRVMGLFGTDVPGTRPSRRCSSKREEKVFTSTACLPYLSTLQLSAFYCSWLSALDRNTLSLKSVSLVPTSWCPDSMVQFCDTLQGLCLCLKTLALLELSIELLEITFPCNTGAHLRQYHQTTTLCAIPDARLPKIKDVTFDYFFQREYFSEVRCFAYPVSHSDVSHSGLSGLPLQMDIHIP